ncbi:hypothetical protein [uncultured Flavobacterium sp.]|uniref:hypothetical protein n=1 Tax=uncultured Flavobacterium sp. TaxID=165435 RepID=UPI0030C820E4
MKKVIQFLLIVLFVGNAWSQNTNNETEYDLLKAPVSPASNLLGFAQSDINKPTDVSEFMVSLQSASDSYTSLPSNYAVDIAPFWLLKSKALGDITTKGLENSYGKNVIPQSLVLSFAIKNVDSTTINFNTNSTYAGFGLKFSIYRGDYDKTTKEKLSQIQNLQKLKLDLMQNIQDVTEENLPLEIIELKEKRKQIFINVDVNDESEDNLALIELLSKKAAKIDEEIEQKTAILLNENKTNSELKTIDDKIKTIASQFQLTRVGFTWDIAGGIGGEFHNKSFNQGKIYNAGVWTTLGYTTEKTGAFLGLVRYLHNPERIFALDNAINDQKSVSTFDTGFRYILGQPQAKLNASLEAIYRSFLSESEIDNSWRLMLNIDYALFKNQKLTFSFGKNYDGTTTKDGNLVAALGMVFGFGNKR